MTETWNNCLRFSKIMQKKRGVSHIFKWKYLMKFFLLVFHKIQAFSKKSRPTVSPSYHQAQGLCTSSASHRFWARTSALTKVLPRGIPWTKDVVFTCLAMKPLVISQSSSAPHRELTVIAFLHCVLHLTNDQLCIQCPALEMQKTSFAPLPSTPCRCSLTRSSL